MKTIISTTTLFLALGLALSGQAQSTTGGRSGGSTASTGSGYLTEGKRPAASSASSMTIADEGASRAYMYVPPTGASNRTKSPDGSGNSVKNQAKTGSKDKKTSQEPMSRKKINQR
ncbi:hypothetical protein [Spirosoma radiotolerans]|uniref:Lipoprotein n=1 Tax=Spirosoma radiotolerans TaxID=1379870 RepID=A0A0E4A1N1_9BACT|nr:hypothetical protein [Spirosoma radiotolerans]AKD58489.1 hypothetical protein SD10_12305 [Spirosoma radiotolerans]